MFRSYLKWPAPLWQIRGYGTVSIAGIQLKLTAPTLDRLHDIGSDKLEPGVAAGIRAAIQPGDTVIEIGGFIGAYTVLLAKLVGDSGRVIVFEPDPVSRACLEKNVRLNELNNVKVMGNAVSNEASTVALHYSRGGEPNATIGAPPATSGLGQELSIEAITLDEFCEREGVRPDYVKIDVEGAEMNVILGGTQTLQSIDRGFLELHPVKLQRDFSTSPDTVLAKMRELGFAIYRPTGNSQQPLGEPIAASDSFKQTTRFFIVREQPC